MPPDDDDKPKTTEQDGLQKKATSWTLASWVKLALTLDGRDKITKVFQYSARMLAWWFAGQTNQVKRFKAVQASLTTRRKAYRLGRSLIEIQKIRDSGVLELFFDPTTSGKNAKADPAWKIIGSALKMIGLLGFWAGDNVNFLTGSGLFDDYRVESQKERIARRNQLKTQANLFANRFYFFGAVAGLVTSLRVYLTFRQTTLQAAQERLVEATSRVEETCDNDDDEHTKSKQLWNEAKQAMDVAKEKQFSIFVTLLKSCMDVVVFSNNPGIDLHKRFRGKKNHEGFHCVCGLISATTVLYNNFPNAKK
ncbi:Peroxisomal biogenesis factor 11 (PEX11) [Seminavis robusta]|uniref:Peroxisomal biogenesis factor 11 (PEX11) n=1 Tax=Seminavis robusta TaxID=568900 RepID=A0A9N8HLF5_9STRA|nr:Peroxisomal biogenesis factor 11 (PEX11) [Seminavis robusta]|eukprot:Sro912_g219300.1 Peroxisomal biogenesis factor 11 (PEX11) (308) ;mRNA; r:11899-13062